MNPFRGLWWRLADDARFVLRVACGSRPRLARFGKIARWFLHVLAGNLPQTIALVLVVWLPLSWRATAIAAVVLVGGFELWWQASFVAGRGGWLHGWRLWWRVRRAFAAEWHESAIKSKDIRSAFGGENRPTVRPIADHPKTAWWPKVEWPVVSAWCGHPPGRSPSEFADFQTTLAANILRVDAVEFVFDRSRDSVGRINLTFIDVLNDTVEPAPSKVNLRLVRNDEGGVA